MLEHLANRKIEVAFGDWRPGDQRLYVSDIRKAGRELGWLPKVDVEEGVKRLFDWVRANRHYFPG